MKAVKQCDLSVFKEKAKSLSEKILCERAAAMDAYEQILKTVEVITKAIKLKGGKLLI